MIQRVPCVLAVCGLLNAQTVGQEPGAWRMSVPDRASALPDPTANAQPSLEIVVDGVMAPVAARITLSCVDSGSGAVTHMLGFGLSGGFEVVQPTVIDLSRSFRQTTEVRGQCRDEGGAIRRVAPRTILVVDAAVQRDSVITLSNAARVDAGVGALSADPALDVVARAHARDMAERRYFDHVTPEGKDMARRLTDAGIAYRTAGENIGGNASAAGVVQAWLDSAGHRRNLLNPEFERIGVGIYRMPSSPYTYYVQVLAR